MYKYIFGPVNSNRLGYSLGIDLLGDKICSFNCPYCEVEKTKQLTVTRKPYVSEEDIINELSHFFTENTIKLDYITLSGKGEPTLNSKIQSIIEYIKTTYKTPLALLTNASLLHLASVRKEILKADLIVPSLDAVSDIAYQKINMPEKSLNDSSLLIEGIYKLRQEFNNKLFVEILFAKGINDSNEEIEKLKQAILYIKPDGVFINTIYRPPAFKNYLPISQQRLLELQLEFDSLIENSIPNDIGIAQNTHVTNNTSTGNNANIAKTLNSLLQIRPCTFDDLAKVFCAERNEEVKLEKMLLELTQSKKLITKEYGSKIFYSLNKAK